MWRWYWVSKADAGLVVSIENRARVDDGMHKEG